MTLLITTTGNWMITTTEPGFGSISEVTVTQNQLGDVSYVPVQHASWITDGNTVVLDRELMHLPSDVLNTILA